MNRAIVYSDFYQRSVLEQNFDVAQDNATATKVVPAVLNLMQSFSLDSNQIDKVFPSHEKWMIRAVTIKMWGLRSEAFWFRVDDKGDMQDILPVTNPVEIIYQLDKSGHEYGSAWKTQNAFSGAHYKKWAGRRCFRYHFNTKCREHLKMGDGKKTLREWLVLMKGSPASYNARFLFAPDMVTTSTQTGPEAGSSTWAKRFLVSFAWSVKIKFAASGRIPQFVQEDKAEGKGGGTKVILSGGLENSLAQPHSAMSSSTGLKLRRLYQDVSVKVPGCSQNAT